jgi:hypothetical protein
MMAMPHRREATLADNGTARPRRDIRSRRRELVSSGGCRGSVGAASMTPGPGAATIGGEAPLCAGREQARRSARLRVPSLPHPGRERKKSEVCPNVAK